MDDRTFHLFAGVAPRTHELSTLFVTQDARPNCPNLL